MTQPSNRRVVLARIPTGTPEPEDFALVDEPRRTPGAGELLLRTIWLSMDPYQRNWMAGARSYGTAAAPGATVIGRAVSEVVLSNDPGFVAGDIVCGETGWQTSPVVSADVVEAHPRTRRGCVGDGVLARHQRRTEHERLRPCDAVAEQPDDDQ